jgi:DNA topoisomerase-3
VVRENYKKFQCDACGWGFFKQIAGRELTVDEAKTLIAKGRVGPLTGFRSKQGRPFAAELVLDESGEPKFAFDAPKEELAPQAAKTAEVVGPCPKCGQEVVLLGNGYRCRATLIDPPQCDFRLGSTILNQPLTPEVVEELLTAKRTRLLEGFISARTRRPFKAHLTLEASGKVGFAFPENGTASKAPRRKGIKKQ